MTYISNKELQHIRNNGTLVTANNNLQYLHNSKKYIVLLHQENPAIIGINIKKEHQTPLEFLEEEPSVAIAEKMMDVYNTLMPPNAYLPIKTEFFAQVFSFLPCKN